VHNSLEVNECLVNAKSQAEEWAAAMATTARKPHQSPWRANALKYIYTYIHIYVYISFGDSDSVHPNENKPVF